MGGADTETQPVDVQELPSPSPTPVKAGSFHDADRKRRSYQGKGNILTSTLEFPPEEDGMVPDPEAEVRQSIAVLKPVVILTPSNLTFSPRISSSRILREVALLFQK